MAENSEYFMIYACGLGQLMVVVNWWKHFKLLFLLLQTVAFHCNVCVRYMFSKFLSLQRHSHTFSYF